MKRDWSYEEFSVFAMLYAATIDSAITEDEEAIIKQRVSEEDYWRIRAVFEQCSDADCIDVILDHRDKYMNDEAGRKRLLDDFRKVFVADDRYSPMEQAMMHVFEQLL